MGLYSRPVGWETQDRRGLSQGKGDQVTLRLAGGIAALVDAACPGTRGGEFAISGSAWISLVQPPG